MSDVVFGTDGVRGVAGAWPIVPEVGWRLGSAVVGLSGAGARVVVGHDTRPSGPALEEAVVHGVLAAGGVPIRAGTVPTAALQVALADGLADIGVMITASHNPAADNGFKVLLEGGRKPDDERAADLERRIAAAGPPPTPLGDPQLPPIALAVLTGWLVRIDAEVRQRPGTLGRRLVIDLANGSLAPHRATLEALVPGHVFWLGIGPGAINDGCGSEHPELLAATVRAIGADAGLAVDGDADRVRLVDGSGAEVPGDALTWLLARHQQVPAVAVTVMSTTALEAGLPGVRVVRTPVGDRHLRAAMERESIPLGAEESGHVLFADHPGGDGLLAGLRVLEAAFASARTVADAVAPFRVFPRRLTKVTVAQRTPVAEVPAVQAAITRGEQLLGPAGRVFVRYSGTEPVLRLLVEGPDAEVVARVSDTVTTAARAALS